MKRICISFVALALVLTFAVNIQSDGKKRIGWIGVYNVSGIPLGVNVDPSTDEYDSLEHFLADGGRIINPGGETSFKVKEGHHVLAGATTQGEGRSSTEVHVYQNQKVTYNIDYDGRNTYFSHRNGNTK